MTAQTVSAETMKAIRDELIAWELREARIYGEPMSVAGAGRKVDAGLAKAPKS